MKVVKRIGWMGAAIAAIGAGVAVFAAMVETRPEARAMPAKPTATLVDVEVVSKAGARIAIRAQGLVEPAEVITLQSEVLGRVVWQDPRLIAGGRVREGDRLLRIDSRDYRLAAAQQRARIEQAEVELGLERGRKRIAEREWDLLGPTAADPEAQARALREPQLRAAHQSLASAKSGYRRAALLVEKSTLRAPFNALVTEESVGIGQQIGPQAPIATLVATDSYLVTTSIPADALAAAKIGAPARVTHDAGRSSVERSGTIVRVLGDMDRAGQMARVVVEVDNPLGEDGDELPLLLGAYVDVDIDAGELSGVIAVPRRAVRGGDSVYVMNADGELEVRGVVIAWRESDVVYVSSGLRGGERVITSRVAAPVAGMILRASGSER